MARPLAGFRLCAIGLAQPVRRESANGLWGITPEAHIESKGSHYMRKRMALLLSALLGLTGILAAAALAGHSASPMQFSAKLNSRQEVPNPRGEPVRAGGSFTATLTGTKLTWKLTFSHLSGPAVAAHIHSGAKRKAGPVIVPLCGPCKSPSTGTAKVSAAVAKALQGSGTYVNVHTQKNPNGEIRGQIGM